MPQSPDEVDSEELDRKKKEEMYALLQKEQNRLKDIVDSFKKLQSNIPQIETLDDFDNEFKGFNTKESEVLQSKKEMDEVDQEIKFLNDSHSVPLKDRMSKIKELFKFLLPLINKVKKMFRERKAKIKALQKKAKKITPAKNTVSTKNRGKQLDGLSDKSNQLSKASGSFAEAATRLAQRKKKPK